MNDIENGSGVKQCGVERVKKGTGVQRTTPFSMMGLISGEEFVPMSKV